jgi:hypothetical protein
VLQLTAAKCRFGSFAPLWDPGPMSALSPIMTKPAICHDGRKGQERHFAPRKKQQAFLPPPRMLVATWLGGNPQMQAVAMTNIGRATMTTDAACTTTMIILMLFLTAHIALNCAGSLNQVGFVPGTYVR